MQITVAPRRDKASAPLSRESIAGAALALADREGLDALSMRRLGGELGVAAMSLYEYFPSKGALLDAIVDRAAREIRLPPSDGDWRARMTELASALLDVLEKHPSAIMIRRSQTILSPGAMKAAERVMTILRGAGFSAEEAARTYRSVFLLTFAFAGFANRETPDAHAAVLSELPADQFPAVREAAKEMAAATSGREQFLWSLDRLLDGVEQALAR